LITSELDVGSATMVTLRAAGVGAADADAP
jgi:hypothetical protein